MINSVLFDENIIYFANRCTLIQLILDPRLDENLSRFYRREDWIFLQKKLLLWHFHYWSGTKTWTLLHTWGKSMVFFNVELVFIFQNILFLLYTYCPGKLFNVPETNRLNDSNATEIRRILTKLICLKTSGK